MSKPKLKSLRETAAKIGVIERMKAGLPPATARPAEAPPSGGGRGGG
jgi:hypothetical protein